MYYKQLSNGKGLTSNVMLLVDNGTVLEEA